MRLGEKILVSLICSRGVWKRDMGCGASSGCWLCVKGWTGRGVRAGRGA